MLLPTPRKINYITTEALIEEIPQLKQYQGIKILFNEDQAVIKVRKKGLKKKPLLYLWDLTRGCYLSSLFTFEDHFTFEVRGLWYKLTFKEGMPQVTPQRISKAS